jgi:response regulator RpfG family c-di-GMP phosphodiesterase
LEENSVDLIISDMRMPEMDGAEFLAHAATISPDTVRILLTGYADMESTVAAINKGKIFKYFSKPWNDNEIILGVKHALEQRFLKQERDRLLDLTRVQNEELQELNATLEEKVVARTKELQQTMDMLESAHGSLKKSFTASIKVLSNIIEMRENTVPGHSRRVAELAAKLATRAGLSADTVQQVLFAGLLHKIGKIGMPDKLLKMAYEDMSAEEYAQFVKHPVIGEGMLLAFEDLKDAATMIRGQHERFDGKGFPDKLHGESIPIGSRILAIVIDYELFQLGTITTQKQSESEVLDFLMNNRKTRYDPKLVVLFHEVIRLEKRRKKDKTVKMRRVVCSRMVPGMVLAEDVMLKDKVLVLSMGHVLTEHTIERLSKLERSVEGALVINIVDD